MQRRRAAHGALLAFGVVAVTLQTRPAAALDKVKVGILATEAFSFMAVDVANGLGVYAENGLEVERVVLLGSAKLHQALRASALFRFGCLDADPT